MELADDSGGRRTRLEAPPSPASAEPARKRAAVELIARHGPALRQAALRYSLCPADADDAYQRTLEIVLVKAPDDRGRNLLGWAKTVAKHEALAIRRNRERLLGAASSNPLRNEEPDPVDSLPSEEAGPQERLERREEIARSREALQSLKPAELRALTLLAEGYSYAEIGEITGFSQTKINRCLSEGRERFRHLVSRSEDGILCAEMRPLLSAFCDGETKAENDIAVREHLRACPGCRATVRAYRAAPPRIAALLPTLAAAHSLLARARESLLRIHSRLPGPGGAPTGSTAEVAVGGAGGGGAAVLTKLLVVCAGTVGGGAAGVATGVMPAPADLSPSRSLAPQVERLAPGLIVAPLPAAGHNGPPPGGATTTEPPQQEESKPAEGQEAVAAEPEAGAVEYAEPSPAPAASVESEPHEAAAGSAAGEFGP
jgi:RNA polymerase sigma factor (sigma-70 family)